MLFAVRGLGRRQQHLASVHLNWLKQNWLNRTMMCAFSSSEKNWNMFCYVQVKKGVSWTQDSTCAENYLESLEVINPLSSDESFYDPYQHWGCLNDSTIWRGSSPRSNGTKVSPICYPTLIHLQRKECTEKVRTNNNIMPEWLSLPQAPIDINLAEKTASTRTSWLDNSLSLNLKSTTDYMCV